MGEARRRRQTENAALTHGGAGPRLAVCMITKNEAENLPRALASVAGIADEVVVVDTGSTDDTVAVAERLGAKVGHFEWRDDFAAARNASIDLATAAWILILDADEELAPESIAPLRRIVSRDPDGPKLIGGTTESRLDSGVTARSPLARLLPNMPCLRYHRAIHEQLTNVDGGPAPLVEEPGLTILHHGYSGSERARKAKVERNIAMLLRTLQNHPDDVASWYYLGCEYGAAGMYGAAVDVFARWLPRIDSTVPRPGALQARMLYALALCALGRAADAAEVAVEGARRRGSAALAAVAAGYLQVTEPNLAEQLARQAIDDAEKTAGEPWPTDMIRAAGLTVLGDLHRQAGDEDAATQRYRAAAAECPEATQPRVRLAELAASQGDLAAARATLLDALAAAPSDPAAHLALTPVERRMGLLQEAYDRLSAQVASTPRSLELRLQLADVLYDAKEPALGADVLAAAEELPELAAAPPAFQAHYFARLAQGYLDSQRIDAATKAFRSAFQADPALAARARRPGVPAGDRPGAPSAAVAGPAVPAGRA